MSCPNGAEDQTSSCLPSLTPTTPVVLFLMIFAGYIIIFIILAFVPKNRFTERINCIFVSPFLLIAAIILSMLLVVQWLDRIIFQSRPLQTPPSTTNNVTGGDQQVEEMTRPTTGVDRCIITILPTLTCKGNDGEKCSICAKEKKDGEVMKFLPSCLHTFHVDCINKWLESNVSCPICQVKVKLPPAVAVINAKEKQGDVFVDGSPGSRNIVFLLMRSEHVTLVAALHLPQVVDLWLDDVRRELQLSNPCRLSIRNLPTQTIEIFLSINGESVSC